MKTYHKTLAHASRHESRVAPSTPISGCVCNVEAAALGCQADDRSDGKINVARDLDIDLSDRHNDEKRGVHREIDPPSINIVQFSRLTIKVGGAKPSRLRAAMNSPTSTMVL